MNESYALTLLLSISTFALSTTLTPGPNNVMLLSSGLTFGYKRTIPHIIGIVVGFPFMILLVGLGLGIIFEKFPYILKILKIVGMLYLFWMAFKIANNHSTFDIKEDKDSKPFNFLQAASFQWVNPKAWVMSMTAISIFVTSKEEPIEQVIIISAIFMISAIFSCNLWTLGGLALKTIIKEDSSVIWFNRIMAILLVASVIPVFFES